MGYLDLSRLQPLRRAVSVPLGLHAGTSISSAAVADAIKLGVRKINEGSALKGPILKDFKMPVQRLTVNSILMK